MATYTLTTTPEQDNLLSWVVAVFNRERDLALSNEDYLRYRIPQLLAPYQSAYVEAVALLVQKGFQAADPITKDQVLTLLQPKVKP